MVCVCVCSVRQEMEEEVRQMQETIQDMERSCDLVYAPYEPDPNHSPVCRNLTQKQGYLYIRKYDIFSSATVVFNVLLLYSFGLMSHNKCVAFCLYQ